MQAVEQAVAAGLKVMVSAGNFGKNPKTGQVGYAGITSPGNAPSATTVGAFTTFQTATRQDDRMASYSSRGPSWYDGFAKPDIVAPGDALKSDRAPGSTLDKLIPSQCDDDDVDEHRGVRQPERHQHGHGGGERRRGAGPAAESRALPDDVPDVAHRQG